MSEHIPMHNAKGRLSGHLRFVYDPETASTFSSEVAPLGRAQKFEAISLSGATGGSSSTVYNAVDNKNHVLEVSASGTSLSYALDETGEKVTGATSLWDGLIACYKMEETGSSDGLRDSSLNATLNHLAITGACGSVAGQSNTARSFDGSNDRFSSSSGDVFGFGDADFTIAVLANFASGSLTQDRILFSKFLAPSDRAIQFGYDSGHGAMQLLASTAGTSADLDWDTGFTPVVDTDYVFVLTHDASADEFSLTVNDGTPITQAYSGGIYTADGGHMIAG